MKTIKQFELKKNQTNFPKTNIRSSRDAAEFVRQFYADDIEIFESCFLLLLNRQNGTMGYAKISQGGITGTVVDIRLILKYAIENLAPNIILCHNHPSGNTTPSEQDKLLTDKVKKGAELLDIQLQDHIIITQNSYFSFADEGLI